MNKGSLVISLDFEMMWGCHEWATLDGYGQSNILQVREVIDKLLSLFNKYGVHATFATVGMIMCHNKKEALDHIPHSIPAYRDSSLSPFKDGYISNISDNYSSLYFAPDIIKKLKANSNIEVGSHTYSHYYCWEQGQTVSQFSDDLTAMSAMSENYGIKIKSVVFPKNQVRTDYLKACADKGIVSYRGNAIKYFNEPKNSLESIKNRICRILDAYFNISGATSIPYQAFDRTEVPINIRASRFIRPYCPKLSCLESLRLRRVKRELLHAAKHCEIYHIWWHPHNFGSNMEENLMFIEEVLKFYKLYHEKYGMESYTMTEIAELLIIKQ